MNIIEAIEQIADNASAYLVMAVEPNGDTYCQGDNIGLAVSFIGGKSSTIDPKTLMDTITNLEALQIKPKAKRSKRTPKRNEEPSVSSQPA